jgi:uncharacterized Zn finger protein (UPF0148 family)
MTGRSSCPECGTILRIRDRSFIGRRVSCPECRTTLKVEATDTHGHYAVKRAIQGDHDHPKNIPSEVKSGAIKKATADSSPFSSIGRLINSPLTAAWLLAIAVSVLIAVLTLSPKFRFAPNRSNPIRVETKQQIESEGIIEPAAATTHEPAPVQEIEKAPPQDRDEMLEISALEPANVEGPLSWAARPKEETSEPPDATMVPEVVVKPVVKLDIPAMMAQKILRYSQPKVRRRDLLDALQEQLGAPIRYDKQDLGQAELDESITFEMMDTTIGEVIKAVVDAAHWEIAIEDAGTRLERKRSQPEP